MEHPGIILKQLREEKGLTEEQLIELIYPDKKHLVEILIIRAWEKGIANLDDNLLIKVAKFFGVSIMYLLGFTSH